MFDQGDILILNSTDCEIRKEGTNRLVATTTRTPNNTSILNYINKDSYCLAKEYESWLWHKRMGHINFDNLVKVNKKQVVRKIPKIIKPANVIRKQC